MMTVGAIADLYSRCIDFTLAYTQAPIDIEIFLELPIGFDVEGATKGQYVLRLKKNLYGLKQAGLSWYETLKGYLEKNGFRQSSVDPCVFYRGSLILLCYVDDCLLFAKHQSEIDQLVAELHETFVMTDEGDVSTYLGIKIEHHTDSDGNMTIKMSQPSLIQRVLDLVQLSDQRMHDTPAEAKRLLSKDASGAPLRNIRPFYRILDGTSNMTVNYENYVCVTGARKNT
jgi:hypothetical protein